MIPIYEYLDRLEILYPDNTKLKDLRRAYVDRDLNSLFRLFDTNFADELRKAVVEENKYSLFRIMEDENFNSENLSILRSAVVNKRMSDICTLLGNEDMGKLLLHSNYYKLWPVLDSLGIHSEFNIAFKTLFSNNIEYDKDCFSRGQVKSKKWLVDELVKINPHLGNTYLCAGWYGLLALMLLNTDLNIDSIRSIDIDPSCEKIADKINLEFIKQGWKFKSSTADILDLNYNYPSLKCIKNDGSHVLQQSTPQTIINTSCEHIADFDKWYDGLPDGILVILQANDFIDVEEHVNTYTSLKEFDENIPMKETLFIGELDLEQYTRFMKIGFK